MEIVFNELSFQNKANSLQEADKAMAFLMDILLEINKITKEAITLKRTIHFDGILLAENYLYEQWKTQMSGKGKQDNALKNKFLLFLKSLDKSQMIQDYPYYLYKREEAQGLGYAFDNQLFAISFNAHLEWQKEKYTLIQQLIEKDELQENEVEVLHFGAENHLPLYGKNILTYLENAGAMLPYDCDSKFSPRDNQTILCNKEVFEFTGKHYTFKGGLKRKIYRHIQNGTYWYVDNLHYGCAEKEGKAAHLEVFDANKNHIGVCNIYDMNINVNRKEAGRTLRMD
jgi:hypothetical protein